ncbi:MAG: sporulation initiation factor Spo0A C-terminal domain-containing protein [Ruminococcus flavefaciens]|nr:sporulation initiation factor Spo0A C-terminal domain-containing protein [Ruminococcus flavefaciens]
MINTKNNIASTAINPFVKIASHMSGLGYYAVSQGNYVKISYSIREYENYCIMLCDDNTDIDFTYAATQIILTDYSDPHKYIIEKDGILHISKYLGEDCICEILKYHLKRADKDTQISKYVTKILLELGAPANLKGYEYLKTAVELSVKNVNLFRREIMSLYVEVAERCQTNVHCVERSIRTVIESIFYKNPKRFEIFFGYPVGKPRNSELIGLIAEKVRIMMDYSFSSSIF